MRFWLPIASCVLAAVLAALPALATEDAAKDRVANVQAGGGAPAVVDPVVVAPADSQLPASEAPVSTTTGTAPAATPSVGYGTSDLAKPEPLTSPETTDPNRSPSAPPAAEPIKAAEAPAAAADPVLIALRGILADARASKLADGDKEDRAALSAFYGSADAARLFVDKSGLSGHGRKAIAEIKLADDWGLKSSDFSVPQLEASTPSNEQLADAEYRLSLAVLKYARHARGGRIPDPTNQLSSYLDRKAQIKDPKLVLEELAKAPDAGAYLRGLHSRHPQFVKLKEQLVALRARPAGDKVLVTVPQGPKILPGKSHPDIAIVRKRLNVPVAAIDGQPGDENFYDEVLVKAVTAFQAEKGVAPSKGAITSATRTAMNADVQPTANARKIIASMESWRWMPDDLGNVHVLVNIPEFSVRVVKNGEIIHSERIITGKVDTQTPIFSDVMETVVIHPYWHVPESIKVKELYPGLARGGDTLTKNGLKMQHNGRDVSPQSVDWSTSNIKAFQVYQPPGPSNVLGVVKFLFPNKHQVYLHDTPTKHLFATSMRTYSHGCVRVRNPVRLAEVLLAEDKGWDSAKVAALIKSGPHNNEIALKTKIPVHVTYMTAWVDETGKLGASRDFYGHEERISLALDGKWTQIARNKDHLAPVKAEPIARLAESKSNAYPSTTLGDFFSNLFAGN
ncbi:MAG: L,D-transpeptidase [Hyphomicrobium sp.]|nr:MAG: L,D-transpeptidase [Hyphomicrobium sp.]